MQRYRKPLGLPSLSVPGRILFGKCHMLVPSLMLTCPPVKRGGLSKIGSPGSSSTKKHTNSIGRFSLKQLAQLPGYPGYLWLYPLRPPQPQIPSQPPSPVSPRGLQRRPVPCWAACATRPFGGLAPSGCHGCHGSRLVCVIPTPLTRKCINRCTPYRNEIVFFWCIV